LAFDGSNDYVDAGTSRLGSTSGTVSFWVKKNTGGGGRPTVIGHQNGNNRLYALFDGTQFTLGIADTAGINSGISDIVNDQWFFLSFTYNNGTWVSYKNGKYASTGSYSGSIVFKSAIRIGNGDSGMSGNTFPFSGKIDEPCIYNYARTAAQIAKDYNAGLAGMGKTSEGASASIGGKSNKWLTDGLVGHWKMDEASWNGTSGEVKDASGNSNNGTASGGATTGAGKFGNGGSFDGTDDKINIGRITQIEGVNNSWSIGGWFKLTSGASRIMFIYDADNIGNTDDLYMYWNGSYVRYQIGGGQAEKTSSITNLSDGSWHHILMIKDGANTLVYEDGTLKDNVAFSGSNFTSSHTFRVGDKCNINSWYGSIDDFRIYNRALSPKEVSDLYNYAPGPVGYWNLDDATGTTAKDLSGNGNNGTLTNGPTWTTQGKYGGAVSFDGSDDYVEIAGNSNLNITNQSYIH
jgi:hypothetical protein